MNDELKISLHDYLQSKRLTDVLLYEQQKRMQDETSGEMQIVYQAPFNKELFHDLPKLQEGLAQVRHFINGIAVDVRWKKYFICPFF